MAAATFVKIEIMRDSKYLLPDNQETIRATEILAKEGFIVMPYMYPRSECCPRPSRRGRGVRHATRCADRYEQGPDDRELSRS